MSSNIMIKVPFFAFMLFPPFYLFFGGKTFVFVDSPRGRS